MSSLSIVLFFFFNDPATTEIYTLSLHDALPIFKVRKTRYQSINTAKNTLKGIECIYALYKHTKISTTGPGQVLRSEEHTSELQSRGHLVCRLLLEKKKKKKKKKHITYSNRLKTK